MTDAPPQPATSACDLLGTGRNDHEEIALLHNCHHERAMSGLHSSMSVLGSFMGVVDQSVGEEIDLEETDPSFLGASNHEEHTDHLHTSDSALRGGQLAVGLIDSFPGMIEQFRGA